MKKKTFRSKYPFRCIYRYIPKRYTGLKDFQLKQQEIIERFKEGDIRDDLKKVILEKISSVIGVHQEKWAIMFIPTSDDYTHEIRYKELTEYLRQHLSCTIYYDAIIQVGENTPIHMGGNKNRKYRLIINKNEIKDYNIIVFDDVITTGRSLRAVGDLLKENGVRRVMGVILAMTIHPNNPIKRLSKYKNKI